MKLNPVVKGLQKGLYGIYVDGQLSEPKAVERLGDEEMIEVVVGTRDADVVVKRAA
jgi:hypothetical protein